MKIFIHQTIVRCAFGLMLSVACAMSLQAQSAGTGGSGGGTGGSGASGGSSGTSGGSRTGGTTSGSGTSSSAGRASGSTPGSTVGTPPASTARPAQGTSTANDGRGTSTTNRTGNTNATRSGTGTSGTSNTGNTNATGTNSTGNAAGTNNTGNTNPNASRTSGLSPNTFGPNGVANGTTGGTTNAGTNNAGTNNRNANTSGNANAGTTPNANAGINANGSAGMSSMAGTIGAFGGTDFTLNGVGATGTPGAFQFTPDTLFTDTSGNALPRDRFFRRGGQVPATVFYNRDANGNMIASRVVLNETATAEAPIEQAGTITEVSPGILVIEQPGASDTPVRFVNNTTTNYVNEAGQPVAPESVKAGTPVRIFYTKVGDTLVASRVEVHQGNKSVLPAPPINGNDTTTLQKVK